MLRVLAILLIPTLTASCFSEKVSRFCDTETLCEEDTTYDWCDLNGEHGEWGKQCIENPGAMFCNDAHPCAAGPCVEGVCSSSGCEIDAHCDAEAPVCDTAAMMCGACTEGSAGDAVCAAEHGTTPFCSGGGGCAQCISDSHCSGNTPICGGGTCTACTGHDQCGSGICDTISGACIAEALVAYATDDGTGTTCAIGDECSLPNAVASDKLWVKLAPGNYTPSATIDITAETRIVGVIGATDPTSARIDAPATTCFDVDTTGALLLEDLEIYQGGSDGVACKDATATLAVSLQNVTVTGMGNSGQGLSIDNCTTLVSQSTLSNNQGGGLTATSSTLTIEQSTISNNQGGGLSIGNSEFTVVNNFIVENQGGGVIITNNSAINTQTFAFNTVYENLTGIADGVSCSTLTAMTAVNNIVFSPDSGGANVLGNCTWEHSIIEDDAANTGTFGTGVVATNPNLDLTDGPRKYHLTLASTAAIDKAGTGAQTPVDFDGDTRPQGTASDIGADEFVP